MTARSNKPELEFAHLRGPARDFALFCAMEMERREISKGEFDLENVDGRCFERFMFVVFSDPFEVHKLLPLQAPGTARARAAIA